MKITVGMKNADAAAAVSHSTIGMGTRF